MTEMEMAAFHQEGFALQAQVVTAEDLAVLRADLDEYAGLRPGPPREVVASAPWIRAEADHFFVPVTDLATRSRAWRDLCQGALHAEATRLLGADARLMQSMGIVKPPLKGQTFPLHQDGIYYGPVDRPYVIANVYLDDVTTNNGSLRLAPRSHGQLFKHDTTYGKKSLPDASFPTIVEPQAKAGDVLWFHLWTVHGSGPNHSTFFRRSARIGYMASV